MGGRAKFGLLSLAVGVAAAALVPLAPASSDQATSAASGGRAYVAGLGAVGGSGVAGLIYAQERSGRLRLHVTLACLQACQSGITPGVIPMRFVFASGRCGRPAGKTFTFSGGKLRPGGLDFRAASSGPGRAAGRNAATAGFDPDNDPLNYMRSLRATWDPDNDGSYEIAACGTTGNRINVAIDEGLW
jgi:hypothetical protein